MYVLKLHDGRYITHGVLKTTLVEEARRFSEAEMNQCLGLESSRVETFVLFEDEVRATIEGLRDRAVALARLLA
jgi:hypothetical protein